jgi:DNA-binding transcriptional ArsR family regulator
MAYGDALAALADPTRRTVFERLRHGARAVGEIADGLPVSRPAVSQHLKVLKEARLVTEYRDGTRRFYAIDTQGLEAVRKYLDGFWDEPLERFKAFAEAEEPRSRKRKRQAK